MSENEKILHEMYRLAFNASTPRGDFDELVANATINEFGQKVIPYMDYECDEDTLQEIVDRTMLKYDVPEFRKRQFSVAFYLGCSPKTKRFSGNKNLVKKIVTKHDIV